MSLLDNMRQSIGNAASSALEVSQNLGAQAQAQIQIKRLQVEHAKKLHELGVKTYAWHKSGTLIAAGVVPREVHDACHQLDDLGAQLDEQNRKLEEAKREAELRTAKDVKSDATISHASDAQNAIIALPPSGTANRSTQILGDSMNAQTYPTNMGIPGGPILAQGALAQDLNQPNIPVPGPDMPPTSPELPGHDMPGVPINPDLPSPGSPSGPTIPGMPAPGGIPGGFPSPGGPSFPSM